MKKVFITGINGFVGKHLLSYLSDNKDLEIFGTVLSENPNNSHLRQVDLTDSEKVEKIISEINPDYVFHLAALTSPAASFSAPSETMINNVKAQFSVLDALRKMNSKAKILVIGSGDEYGLVDRKDNPISEKHELKPSSPYAVSKVAQDFLGLQYFLGYHLSIVRVRPFNHIGPGQSPAFVVASFAKQIAEIEAGVKKDDVINVGNLSAIRDFCDVEDMVKAYWLAINHGEAGEVYNLGSGVGRKMEDILNALLSLSSKKITINVDSSLVRPVDNPELVCDFSKFHKLTAWKPVISFEDTLKKILDYWRLQINKEVK